MEKVEGQCYGCYSNSMFQYFGQTGEFNETENKEKYFKSLKKPIVIECITCGNEVEYLNKD